MAAPLLHGYSPKPVDIVPFWRPTLEDCPSKHYHPQAGKALPAVIMGVVAQVGSVDGKRIPLLDAFIRVDLDKPDEESLKTKALREVAKNLGGYEVGLLALGLTEVKNRAFEM
jgi:hypothetical protein